MEQILIFQVGPEYLGLEAVKIHQISDPMKPVRVPNAPVHILGIANFRGAVIPVIDLRRRLGIEPLDRQAEPMMIVAEEATRKVGLVVDRVVGLKRIKPEAIDSHPQLVSTKFDREFFRGVCRLTEYPVFLLDLKKILTK